ncbi:Polyamine aminopropyltransferase [Gracilariopsis chorda]|uniref:Polyamine aminopropyltransferase n=1 Tax=Gracilariopsis chorda TaxID=448386 RepID=A0A2V3IH36_9FLOR|nr:Polyamine aminopropyltransferase [Gracilariopsis chorda]PXF41361.1 Polyamine aminopropyltransferase [Gracilariopsis chorda]|eukprot:PXF41348.1 Polyamine aminopropyltransferase [Gracilariopsis chorda]
MSGPTSLRESNVLFPRTCAALSSVFTSIRPSQVFEPTCGPRLGIVIATDKMQPLPEANELDLNIAKSINGEMNVLDGASVHGHFASPRCLRKAVMEETEIFTIDNQVPTFGEGILNRK